MFGYVLYDEVTEEIIQEGWCSSEEDMQLQTRDGLKLLAGVSGSRSTHKVVGGKMVEKTKEEKEASKPKPIEITGNRKYVKVDKAVFDDFLSRVTALEQKIAELEKK